MAEAPGQDKEMPDAVEMAHFLVEGVKDYTHRIKETTRKKPSETGLGQGLQKRAESNEHKPAHNEVNDYRQDPFPLYGKELQQNPDNCQPPYSAEEGPAPDAAKSDQRKGSVGAGYEQIDGNVIEPAEDDFWLPAQGMVK